MEDAPIKWLRITLTLTELHFLLSMAHTDQFATAKLHVQLQEGGCQACGGRTALVC